MKEKREKELNMEISDDDDKICGRFNKHPPTQTNSARKILQKLFQTVWITQTDSVRK